jgi:hypothetical protein
MSTTDNNTGIVVAFKVGRGGRFHNSGHTTYIGEHRIGEFTDDLFLQWENRLEVYEELSDVLEVDNLFALYEKSIEENDEQSANELREHGFDLGKLGYFTETGHDTCLKPAHVETGVGRIDIDGEYYTVYTKFIEDCTESELEKIAKAFEGYSNGRCDKIKYHDAEYWMLDNGYKHLFEGNSPEDESKYDEYLEDAKKHLHTLDREEMKKSLDTINSITEAVEEHRFTFERAARELLEILES